MMEEFHYKPGECNIDEIGVNYRKKLSYLAGIGAVIALVLVYYFDLHPTLRFIIMAVFGYAVSINVLQVKEQFCVANASMGTMETGRKMLPVTSELYKTLDRKKRNAILTRTILYSLLGGALGLLPL